MTEQEFYEEIFKLGLTIINHGDGEKAVGHPKFANPLLWFNDEEEYQGSVTLKSINVPLYTAEQIKQATVLVDAYLRGK